MCNIMSGEVKRNESFSTCTMLGGGILLRQWIERWAKTIDLAKLWLTGVCMRGWVMEA